MSGILRAPVGEMHAAAAHWLTLAPELGASAPAVGTSWPSAAGMGEMHLATQAAGATLMGHLASRAGSLTASAVIYSLEDVRDADPFKALS